MPVYISLIKWTDQGRGKVSSLPDRIAEVDKRIEAMGGKSIANWLTMGRFDQVAVAEAPDDETAAKLLMVVAERGNAVTETLRAFTMDEVRGLLAWLNDLPTLRGLCRWGVGRWTADSRAVRVPGAS
jgi:uncharacterized protein with GYD domain